MAGVREYYERELWKYADKDLAIDDALAHLSKYGEERVPGPGNPYIPDKIKDQLFGYIEGWAKSVVEGRLKAAPQWQVDLANFELKALSKWVGPQGATPTCDEIMSVVQNYFDPVKLAGKIVIDPTDHVLFEWTIGINKQTIYMPTPVQLYKLYRGDRKSTSALTGWSDRRIPAIRKRAIKESYRFNTLDPIVLGSRDQRCKIPCRAIFMDSFANYFREVKAFHWMMSVWKDSDMMAWRGDRYVERYVHNFTQHCSRVLYFEADYEAMDNWMDKKQFTWFMKQCDKVLSFDRDQRSYITMISEQLFTVPVFTPKGPTKASHSLLSGLFPTNLWESPHNALIQLMFVEFISFELLKMESPMHIGVDFILVVNGDDSLLVFNLDKNPDLVTLDLKDIFATWVWENFHIKARSDKQRVSEVSGFFCKRQYKLQGMLYDPFEDGHCVPKSIYPIALALNGYLYPEDGTLDSKSQTLIKVFQLFDNVYGHPQWKGIVRRVWECSPDLQFSVSDDDVVRFNELHNNNWRFIIFGEKFSLAQSPTAKFWFTLCSNR